MPCRSLVIPVATVALLVAGCSSPHDPKTDPPPTRSAASTTATSTAATTTSAGPAATSTPGTVPVDQIPPGRPASWIPAGMPTVAPWKEPGDVLPRFSLAMFEHTPAGAMVAARYYTDAQNWSLAALDPTPFLLLCESKLCRTSGEMVRGYSRKRQHISGGRELALDREAFPAPAQSTAEWIVRTHLIVHAGELIGPTGAVLGRQSPSTLVSDLYMRWGGRFWLVHEDALAPKGTK